MFNQHLQRATSRSSKPPIVRAYDGSAIRPDSSAVNTFQNGSGKVNLQSTVQLSSLERQMEQGFKAVNESLLAFSEKVSQQFQQITTRLERLESMEKQLTPPSQSKPLVPIPQVQMQMQQIPQQVMNPSTSFNSFMPPPISGQLPTQFQMQQFNQLLGAQISKHIREFNPQTLYDHFFQLGQTVVDYFNNAQALSERFGFNFEQMEVGEAYQIIYERVQQDIVGFANTVCGASLISENCQMQLLEQQYRQVFKQSVKIGNNYSFSLLYTAFAIVLVLRFQANLLRFSDITGTLGEFQEKYGIQCQKDAGRKCQVILPQWIGKIQIAAYVKLVR